MGLKYVVRSTNTGHESRTGLLTQRPIPQDLVGRFCEHDKKDDRIVGVYEFTEDGSFSYAPPSFHYIKGNRLKMRSSVLSSPDYYRAKSPSSRSSSLMRQSVLYGYWTWPKNTKRFQQAVYFRADGTYTYTFIVDEGPPPRTREYVGKYEDWPRYRGGPNGWGTVLILPRVAYARASGNTIFFDRIYDGSPYSADYHFQNGKAILVVEVPQGGTKRLLRCEEEAFHVSKI